MRKLPLLTGSLLQLFNSLTVVPLVGRNIARKEV